jgi:hypothetical protein
MVQKCVPGEVDTRQEPHAAGPDDIRAFPGNGRHEFLRQAAHRGKPPHITRTDIEEVDAEKARVGILYINAIADYQLAGVECEAGRRASRRKVVPQVWSGPIPAKQPLLPKPDLFVDPSGDLNNRPTRRRAFVSACRRSSRSCDNKRNGPYADTGEPNFQMRQRQALGPQVSLPVVLRAQAFWAREPKLDVQLSGSRTTMKPNHRSQLSPQVRSVCKSRQWRGAAATERSALTRGIVANTLGQ